MAAPYSQVQFMPTGGISLNNVSDYLAIGQGYRMWWQLIATTEAIDNQDKQTIARNIQNIHSLLKNKG